MSAPAAPRSRGFFASFVTTRQIRTPGIVCASGANNWALACGKPKTLEWRFLRGFVARRFFLSTTSGLGEWGIESSGRLIFFSAMPSQRSRNGAFTDGPITECKSARTGGRSAGIARGKPCNRSICPQPRALAWGKARLIIPVMDLDRGDLKQRVVFCLFGKCQHMTQTSGQAAVRLDLEIMRGGI